MEEFFELLGSFLVFLLRTVVFAFYSIFLLIGGIFSPSIRAQVRERWRTSTWEQASMITGMLLGLGIIFVTFAYVVPALTSPDEEAQPVNTSPPAIEEASGGEKGIGESLRDQAIDKGAEYLKKKLRKEE